ncbi:hypothetical protein ASC87_00665 [Rhizobacter sp. Root1221]|nr:hypothetical protein ASC87_00665 [Rhizobacter sp. Root1221]
MVVMLAAAVAVPVAVAANSNPAPTKLSLPQALLLAEQRAPSLVARQSAFDSAQVARPAAGHLPDPKLTIGVDNYPVSGPDRFSWNRDSMTMRRVGLMQDVPNAAKRAAQRDGAEAKAAREQALWQAERLAVRREAAAAWINRHYAERKLAEFAVLERENQVLQQTLAVRIATGKSMPADATMARQELLMLAERREELASAVEQTGVALRRWIGEAVEHTTGEMPVIELDTASLLGRLDRHGELIVFAPALAMARAEVDEASAGTHGDWGWEVGYGNRSRAYGGMVSFQLTFELPLSSATRQDPQIAARRKDIERLEAEREDVLRRIDAEVRSQMSELQRLESAALRQRTAAMPLAAERVKLTLTSYEAGRADLGAVLAARKDAAEVQLRALDLEAQLMAQRARLAYLVSE